MNWDVTPPTGWWCHVEHCQIDGPDGCRQSDCSYCPTNQGLVRSCLAAPRDGAGAPLAGAHEGSYRAEDHANRPRTCRQASQTETGCRGSGRRTAGTVSAFAPSRTTNLSTVLTLVERGEGATSAELVGAAGWQAHTVRAALSGLRQKGHVIEISKYDRLNRYHAASAIRAV